MKTSTFIRRSMRHLWDGKGAQPTEKQWYVCDCLEEELRYAKKPRKALRAYMRALDHIERLLGPAQTLGVWLRFNHGINIGESVRRMQVTRRAWMEDMAAYFESKGD